MSLGRRTGPFSTLRGRHAACRHADQDPGAEGAPTEGPATGRPGDEAPALATPPPAPRVRFEEFGLPGPLMQAIAEAGFEYCTPIQAETLQHSLSDYDVTGQAQTGTGKTAAFLITLISHQLEYPLVEPSPPGTPRALVIAPTRELAMQIASDAELLCGPCRLKVLSVVGGMDFEKQRRTLETETVDILVATPGRLLDFLTRGKVDLRRVEQLVLDEADRMLSMGFIPDVRRIIRQTPPKNRRQTLLFSATFSDDILRLAEQWTLEAEKVVIEPESVATDRVEQRVYLVTEDDKFPLLYNLMSDLDLERVIVFANRRDTTREIQERLAALGVDCELLSGEVPQNKRVRTLERFKEGKTRVLAATDVAGRGLHVEAISHVINYDLPEDPEDYVHRIGRTGRAGATGISISFVGETDAFLLPEIETLLGMSLTCTQPEASFLVAPEEARRPKSSSRGGARRPGSGRPGSGRPGSGRPGSGRPGSGGRRRP
ncbi:MAG: DEAD/DEAH box helicase [Pseudomonadales bacterium]|jgi:ATP-dependent RNA helicase RhlB|nr:DEAD/DEAH box helicase [Pseudomonadales bacterium]